MGLIGALAQVKSLMVRKADFNFIYFHGNDLMRFGGLDGQYGSSIERTVEIEVKGAQRLKVYTGPTNNGRFLNGAELTCPMTTRLVESCLWILVTGAQPTR